MDMTQERVDLDALPAWESVVVVVAHPDDESFGLGAVIDRFVTAGAAVSVLCFTHGEASTLHGVDGDLATLRAGELAAAARVLGIASVRLLEYPDGGLDRTTAEDLADDVLALVDEHGAQGLLVFDAAGVTGHRDHMRATAAAVVAGERRGLGVLAWTVPDTVAAALAEEYGAAFVGHSAAEVDLVIPVVREHQLDAVTCHPSQAVPGSVLWRRLELQGSWEHLRWLRPDVSRASAGSSGSS
jgi:LmbE family N-acetylglucosaminyl deacetylase